MAEIALTQGKVAIVDDADFDWLNQWKWTFAAAPGRIIGYATRCECRDGRQVHIKMHRLILGASPGRLVDHANGCGLDNRRANLRLATGSENCANSAQRGSLSGFRGVYRERSGRWFAQIRVNSRFRRLGTFDTPEEAARAYDAAAAQHFGEFAVLNFRTEGLAA